MPGGGRRRGSRRAQYLALEGKTRTYFHGLCLWGSGSLAVAGSGANDETNAELLVAKYVR